MRTHLQPHLTLSPPILLLLHRNPTTPTRIAETTRPHQFSKRGARNFARNNVRMEDRVSKPGSTAELSNNPVSTIQPSQSRRRNCRFFVSKGGCKAGEACQFHHDPTLASDGRSHQPRQQKKKQQEKSSATLVEEASTSQVADFDSKNARQYDAPPPGATRLVQRPIPQSQSDDPRTFQLGQIKRRYHPSEKESAEGVSLTLKVTPSDPDFPFDIAALDCILTVPSSYPSSNPSLRVTNREMGRGFQINVEKGFDDIVNRAPKGTLLQYLSSLDKQLENFLAAPKAETVTLVGYVDRRHLEAGPSGTAAVAPSIIQSTNKPEIQPENISPKPIRSHVPIRTPEQIAQAQKKREVDLRQLEARLGRLPLYAKSVNGLAYTIPIEPRKWADLPTSLKAVKTLKLIVPHMYNLDPCRIQLQGVDGEDVTQLEESFRVRVESNPNLSLIAHINYLSQNMHAMVKVAEKPAQVKLPDTVPLVQAEKVTTVQKTAENIEDDRNHIITIPRPPEWSVGIEDDETDSDNSYSYDSGDESDDEAFPEDNALPQAKPSGPERGIMLSLPFLELHGIELLELVSLSITIKCDRCKTTMDTSNIKNYEQIDHSGIRSESCRKCASALDIGYRMDMMHANSVRAGYLDLDGCTVVDLLPSNFIPTCSECSTSYPTPGIVSVRGESSMTVCRECHSRMSFRIPEVKFLQVSAAAVRASRTPPRKKKERLGVVAGQELPLRGKCSHYRKSYRWFRFSCCNKVFPCDKCHNDAEGHPNEHANRMLCGFCSREQNYRPEDCSICHAVLIGKKGSGFWEGGKGTRDKSRMSRKDPRKYKRNPGSKFKPLDRSTTEGKKKVG
ncbi:hypothetical protein EJ08DRAFT_627787 [Tothia fuscella]|uniref:CHY-type domain-containing protein n=1 Tax=Tothia fuscella TaxID=1048955 RepID=A0A9P4U139_9PEZI|nr:hypothetical protein EJ08DRAFT_627787 [Tothia fuscella]